MRRIYETCKRVISFYLSKLFHRRGYGISILVPLCLSDGGPRARNWAWLQEYWRENLPGAEIVVGEDADVKKGLAFSKSVAVNNAVSKALGDIFVVVDADGYISVESVLLCAKEIRTERKRGYRVWFVPYRKFFRLTEEATKRVLESDPKNPHKFSTPPSDDEILNKGFYKDSPEASIGHWYGALIQIMSREAFEEVGGWDSRFRGWGGEDHAAMRAMDTLYGPHKTLPSPVLHLWHPIQSSTIGSAKNRVWNNQTSGSINDALSGRYYWSQGNIRRMRSLVDEFRFLKVKKIQEVLPDPVNANYSR